MNNICIGGSLTKLVYRSKEDYKDGKPLRVSTSLKQLYIKLN